MGAPLCFGVVRAAIRQVHPAACGTFRALRDRDPVGDGWDLSRLERARVRKTTGILVFSPREYRVFDCGEATLMALDTLEGWRYLRAVSAVLNGLECFAFDTWRENTVREEHAFSVFVDGKEKRFVRACKGCEVSGWHWEADGTPHGIEDVSAYEARWPSQRMNRDRVLAMAAKLNVDAETVLADPSKGRWINATAR